MNVLKVTINNQKNICQKEMDRHIKWVADLKVLYRKQNRYPIKKLTFNGLSAHVTQTMDMLSFDEILIVLGKLIGHSRTGWSKNNWFLTKFNYKIF